MIEPLDESWTPFVARFQFLNYPITRLQIQNI